MAERVEWWFCFVWLCVAVIGYAGCLVVIGRALIRRDYLDSAAGALVAAFFLFAVWVYNGRARTLSAASNKESQHG